MVYNIYLSLNINVSMSETFLIIFTLNTRGYKFQCLSFLSINYIYMNPTVCSQKFGNVVLTKFNSMSSLIKISKNNKIIIFCISILNKSLRINQITYFNNDGSECEQAIILQKKINENKNKSLYELYPDYYSIGSKVILKNTTESQFKNNQKESQFKNNQKFLFQHYESFDESNEYKQLLEDIFDILSKTIYRYVLNQKHKIEKLLLYNGHKYFDLLAHSNNYLNRLISRIFHFICNVKFHNIFIPKDHYVDCSLDSVFIWLIKFDHGQYYLPIRKTEIKNLYNTGISSAQLINNFLRQTIFCEDVLEIIFMHLRTLQICIPSKYYYLM